MIRPRVQHLIESDVELMVKLLSEDALAEIRMRALEFQRDMSTTEEERNENVRAAVREALLSVVREYASA
jgi:hypothetical protein